MKKIILFFLMLNHAYSEIALFSAIPEAVELVKEKVALGKRLFNDTLLSGDRSLSCATCHNINNFGVDSRPISFGDKGQRGTRNTPTVFNAVFNVSQFWDGRAKDLETQALMPIVNPQEMNLPLTILLKRLKENDYYSKFFESLYVDGITEENVANAIAEYEKSLITPNSNFDKFLKGDKSALSGLEKEGFLLFQSYGCVACHNGVNLGGKSYQKIGIFGSYDANSSDLGRYDVTKKEQDRFVFKVPSLRNIAKTGPYLHDGSVETLEATVMKIALLQLGRPISKADLSKIVAFLNTLTGALYVEK